MSKFIKFPSIGQFRNTCKSVIESARFVSFCKETNQVITNPSAILPIVTFTGTVKAHGTNAAVGFDPKTGEVWAQKRNGLATIEKDNAGFAFFVESNKEFITELLILNTEDGNDEVVTIFGEWCGGNIQKGVAICELEKMFIAFACKQGEDWKELEELPNDSRVYYISDFPTYTIDIDFNCPEKSINSMTELTDKIELECPIGKHFGVSGIGEGVVWSGNYKGNNLRFKVKGEKHSSSKVKKLASVDIEKLKSIQDFVDYSVTENRLMQGIEQVFTIESKEPNIKDLGTYLKWIMSDIVKEEMDTLLGSGLEPKDVGRPVSTKARIWFIDKYVGI